ncbi:MAG TPA: kelch repeat-containing protein, partial [Opitutaceae bacterium]|nr:kelch repeat-containing protein [Opitutaceae bacterium]
MHRLLVACAASSALLMLGLGGSGLSAASQVSEAGSLVVPRKGHTATVLNDGRVLIVGGRDAAGDLASAELFDPTSRSFSWIGAMETARSGHAATLLPDGRVLVTGGNGAAGALASAEIFDPAAIVSFSAVTSTMGAARVGHTATLMADGRVLIAGGDAAGTAEWFDSATGAFPGALIAMTEIRSKHTATAVGDGLVLVAGGGSNTVEFFDAAEGTFAAWPRAMNEVRIGHSAVANADDTVLMVGGESAGTLENFDPSATDFSSSIAIGAPGSVAQRMANDRVLVLGPSTAGVYDGSNGSWFALPELEAPALHRDGQTATELAGTKEILVIGGSDSSEALVGIAATYNPARLETDKADYYPEEEVIVTGTGWKAGEEVDLFVVDDQGWNYDSTVTADNTGTFVASPLFVVLWQHLGVTFDLTGYGVDSGLSASHTFTDGTVVFNASGLPSGVSVSVDWEYFNAGGTAVQDSGTVGFTTPAASAAAFPNRNNRIVNYSFPSTVSLAGIDYSFVSGSPASGFVTGGGGAVTTVTGTYQGVSVVTWVNPADIAYGTPLGGTQLNATANVSGAFVYSPAAGAILDAGNNQTLSVTFTPTDSTFSTVTKDVLINVLPKAASVTPDAASKTYGDSDPTLTGALSGFLPADGVTATYSRTVGESVAGSPYTISATLAPAGVLSNYNITYNTADFTIEKADAVISVTGYSVTFDASVHTATGTATGGLGEDLSGLLDLSGTSHTNAGSYPSDPWSFPGDANHNPANGTVANSIAKADAVVTVTGYSGTYDAAAHGATGSATGVALDPTAAGSSLDLGATFTDVPGGTANWTFTGGTNYNDQNGSVEIEISKADATVVVSGYTGTYDAAAHGASGSATGVALDPTAVGSTLDLGASFTDVPGGTANWTFIGGTNYNDQSGSVAIDISKADAVVTVNGYSGTYDAAAHGATGSATGVALDPTAAGSTLDLGATFTDVPGGTANWTFTGGTNYNDQSGSVAIDIAKANAVVSVTGYSGTYDAAAHGATGSATGVALDPTAAGS